MAATATIRDLRNRFPTIRKVVEQEGEVVVTEHGTPDIGHILLACRSKEASRFERLLEAATSLSASSRRRGRCRGTPPRQPWRARTKGALPMTPHVRLEIVTGICLAAFRKVITAAASRDALSSLNEGLAEGR